MKKIAILAGLAVAAGIAGAPLASAETDVPGSFTNFGDSDWRCSHVSFQTKVKGCSAYEPHIPSYGGPSAPVIPFP